MVYDDNNYALYQQNGGKVETDINSESYTGPSINVSDKTIKMKIGLVKSENDDTLPSYLVPILDCAKEDKSPASQTTSSSVVMVTLSGNNLIQVTDTTGFTCEITSNFLTGTEKSAITIETYYQDSANAIVHNTIYFDESLLKSYDKDKNLTIAKNPFTADADAKPSTDSSSEPSYTFTFDFDTIITEIKNLPAYQLIQSMFKVAYNVTSGKSSTACLVKISDGAFLNLNFTGVPFNTDNISAKSDKNKLLLSISTTQATGIDGCIFKDILGELKLQDNLKQVLELKDYPIDCSRMAAPPSQTPLPAPGQTPPAQTESNSSSVTGVAPMTKTDSELTNIKESINKLLKQMNDLTSKQTNTQGQSTAMNQKFLVGAPSDKNVCGKGGIGLKSDGTIVSIQVPISLVMDEIMTPKMLEMYTSSNRQPASQKPSALSSGPAASALSSGPAADAQSGNILASSNAPPIVQNLNAQPGNGAQPGSSDQPSVIELDAAKKDALQAAKGKLGELTTKLTTARITPLPAGVEALQNAVEAAEQAVTAFGNAAADNKPTAKTAAEGKIDTATGLVAAAESAAQTAIDTKPTPPPANDDAAKIQELTGKLEAAKQKFEDAKNKLAQIKSESKPTIESKDVETALAAADAAIKAIASAVDKTKTTAISTAETAVNDAENAVNEFNTKVDAAAGASKPTGEGVPDYAAYEAAYKAYDNAKKAYEAAYKKASDTAGQAGGAPVSDEDKKAAKEKLNTDVKSVVSGIDDKYKDIQKIQSSDDFDKQLTEAGAKKAEITKLTDATNVYTESLAQLTQLQATYEAAVAYKDDEIHEPEGEKTEEEEKKKAIMQTYTDFYNTFKQCLVVGQDEPASEGEQGEVRKKVVSDNFLTTLSKCFNEDNKYKDTNVKSFFEAVQAASLNSKAYNIDSEKFQGKNYNQTTEGNNINHELLLAIINSLAPPEPSQSNNITDNSFEELIKRLTGMLGNNDSPLMTEITYKFKKEEEAGGFSLHDGGSNKPKSTTKSKSKSTPKSKPKNKTKKNHSKSNPNPNPNKSKTPKIKMNE